MRRILCIVAGVALTITFTGCGDSQPEAGPVPFKATTSPAIEALRENMSKNAKGGVYTKQAPEAITKSAATKIAPAKEPEKKP